jgi:hypothetical protein
MFLLLDAPQISSVYVTSKSGSNVRLSAERERSLAHVNAIVSATTPQHRLATVTIVVLGLGKRTPLGTIKIKIIRCCGEPSARNMPANLFKPDLWQM